MKKLAIITTHPIQYHVPWLRCLAQRQIPLKVFYTWEQASEGRVFDKGFGKEIHWDIPLLQGYDYEFVRNISPRPGAHHFLGIINEGLTRAIESWGADCLLVIGWSFYSHLSCILHFHKRMPVLFRGDSVLLHERGGLRRIARKILLTWIYRHVDQALYAGVHNKAYFLRHGLKPSQLIFCPNTVDIDRFAEPDINYTHRAESWKKELGIPPGHITVLFAGKMTKVKNPGFILDLAEACKDLPVSFILAGDGSLKASLMNRAGGNARIIFLGFQNQSIMPVVYRLGDIYIMPSLHETWGLGINEAMACGRPVMASDQVGCTADLVLENKTGIRFAPGDIKKCRNFLENMIAHRDRLTGMGANAKVFIQLFSFSRSADNIYQLLVRFDDLHSPVDLQLAAPAASQNPDKIHPFRKT